MHCLQETRQNNRSGKTTDQAYSKAFHKYIYVQPTNISPLKVIHFLPHDENFVRKNLKEHELLFLSLLPIY